MKLGFNKNSKKKDFTPAALAARPDKTTSHQGGTVYALSDPYQILLSNVCFMGEPGFYDSKAGAATPTNLFNANVLDNRGSEIMTAAHAVATGSSPEDLLVIANWARSAMNMRLYPQLLLAAFAKWAPTAQFTPSALIRYMPKVCQRPDDLLQVVALFDNLFGAAKTKGSRSYVRAKFPAGLKKAMVATLKRYSLYQLVKYNRPEQHPNYRDVTGILKSKALRSTAGATTGDEKPSWPWRKDIFKFLVHGEYADTLPEQLLARRDFNACTAFDDKAKALATKAKLTWENIISKFGSSKEAWAFAATQMGPLALLRNLRNMLDNGVDPAPLFDSVFTKEKVAEQKIHPYQLFSARDALRAGRTTGRSVAAVIDKLADYADVAADANIPLFKGKTVILVDTSGSMTSNRVSQKSNVTSAQAAGVLAAFLARRSEQAKLYLFDTTCKELPIRSLKCGELADYMQANSRGGGTDVLNAFYTILKAGELKDAARVVMLSDNECGNINGRYPTASTSVITEIAAKHGNVFIHAIDTAGYNHSVVPPNLPRYNHVSAFSEKITAVLQAFEARFVEAPVATTEANVAPTIEFLREQFKL